MKVCGGKFSLLLLIIVQAVGFTYVMMRLQYFNPPPSAQKPENTHILILSTWRSGSSFTGQIFSQHPDVFYLMEPAWHIWTTFPKTSIKVLQMAVRDLIRSVFVCDMSVFDAYMLQRRKTLFQWESSRALCSPPACNLFQRSDIISQSSCRAVCNLDPFDNVEKSCKSYSHVVLKEVRVFDLKSLYPLFKDPSLNLKVLHLVRDPRAVFQSRIKATSELFYDNAIVINDLSGKNTNNKTVSFQLMERICNSQVDMYLSATNGSLSSLASRYMMVRYEDIVQNPIEKAKQMYEFSNLIFTPKLKDWIYNLTHGKGQGNNFIINSKDAVNISKAWRKSLQFESATQVQHFCTRAMEVFGYRLLKTKEEQNDLNYELLLPLPKITKTSKKPSD